MPFTIADFEFGVGLPAIVAITVLVVLPRIVRRYRGSGSAGKQLNSCVAPIALGAGFEVGYWSLALGPMAPDSHWHWLPYVVVAGAVVGAISQIVARTLLRRGMLFLACSVVGAFLLTPTWNDLEPARAVYLIVWPLLVTVIAMGIDASLAPPRDQRQMVYAVVLVATCLSASILLLLADNLRFSHMALAMFGASAGLLTTALVFRDHASLRLTAYPVAVGLCGLMLIGRVNSYSSVPLVSWLLIPLAPCGLLIAVSPRIQAMTGRKRVVASLGPPLLISATALGIALWAVREMFE